MDRAKMDLTYTYIKPRRNFGRQPMFCEIPVQMLDSISPDVTEQKRYILKNPVSRETQTCISQSEQYVNTKRIILRDDGVNHAEGGWPKDIHFADEEFTSRYRRRFERDDAYVEAVLGLYPKFDHYIKQNNAIEMYEQYFKEMPATDPVEKSKVFISNIFQDPESRPIASISWTCQEEAKLVASYCDKRFPVTNPVNSNLVGYIWNLETPLVPAGEFHPPTACWQAIASPAHPSIIIGGLEDGRVCIFDIREKCDPIAISPLHLAHRDPISALVYLQSRVNNEFFSGSTDGRCMWWDVRNISLPFESRIMSIRIPLGETISMANAEPVTSLQYDRSFPSKFLCGTDTGIVISVNRKGKNHNEVMSGIFYAHNGPVKALHRSPAISKMFVTCGDWTTHIWSEDIKTSPIITGITQRYQINDVTWVPQKISSYMSVSADGKFRYWDFLRRYRGPLIVFPLAKHSLFKIKPNEDGSFVAIGDKKGAIYLLSLSDNLIYPGEKDKQLMMQTYEREAKREHIIETRVKEIRLKLKTEEDEAAVAPAEVDEGDILRAVEDEYRKGVQEEIRSKDITTSSGGGKGERKR